MKSILKLAAIAAVVISASPAAAAISATASAQAKGLVLQPLTLTKVSDLDFGTIIASAPPPAPWRSIANSGARYGDRRHHAGADRSRRSRRRSPVPARRAQIVLLTLAAPAVLDQRIEHAQRDEPLARFWRQQPDDRFDPGIHRRRRWQFRHRREPGERPVRCAVRSDRQLPISSLSDQRGRRTGWTPCAALFFTARASNLR